MPLTGVERLRGHGRRRAAAHAGQPHHRRRGADRRRRLRSTVRQQMLADGEPRIDRLRRASHHRADGRRHRRRARATSSCLWAGPGFHIVHYPLRHGTLFNIVAVFRTSTYPERGDVAGYRAELEHTYRDSHPTMKALLAMMDLGAAPGDRRPRSDPPLAQGPRGAARRCRASDAAVAGARRLHGDRGRPLPRRTVSQWPTAISQAAFRRYEGARYAAHRARAVRIPLSWDVSITSDGIEPRSRIAPDAGRADEADMFECLAWLYDGLLPVRPSVETLDAAISILLAARITSRRASAA